MGPLAGVKVVELAGIGPAPFCGMLLGDLGADVLRIDRTGPSDLGLPVPRPYDLLNRNKRSVAIDLKSKDGVAAVLRLVEQADVLIEGFRPGVTEKLGLGPAECRARNKRLVYGRMTGWGQEGPLAAAAGHDLNYIALVGALHSIGRRGGPPTPPLNLVGDFGGGALYLAIGLVAALFEARGSGEGQVVDAAMVDGAASLMTMFYAFRQMGRWTDKRGDNVLDSGAPWYDVYETRDGKWVSIAAIEGKFYRELIERIGLAGETLPAQHDRERWDELRDRFRRVFLTKTRDEWCDILSGSDACFAPVLSLDEAASHPHAQARASFVAADGVTQPRPAPRFSRTPGELRRRPPERGADAAALAEWGFSASEIARLKDAKVLG